MLEAIIGVRRQALDQHDVGFITFPPEPPVSCYNAGEANGEIGENAVRESAQWQPR